MSRFDLYPAAATLLALLAIRRAGYSEGAIWLGVAAAFKGYALFLVPAFCVFIFYQRGLVSAIYAGVLMVAPMILSVIAAAAFVGWGEALSPFRFQMQREFNLESTYAAVDYLFGTDLREVSLVPQLLQVSSAFVAAAMRPRTFEDLVNAFIFATLGFMTFSFFYSPQFVLWILPLVCFSSSRVMIGFCHRLIVADLSIFPDQLSPCARPGAVQSHGDRGQLCPLIHDA